MRRGSTGLTGHRLPSLAEAYPGVAQVGRDGQHDGVPESPALTAAWQQADAHRARGDLPAAKQVLEPAAEVAKAAFGADHPDVLATQQRLALVHRDLGDLPAARRVLEEALASGQARFGDADPLLLALSAELGGVAERLANRHEARRNYARVVQYGPQVLGGDHPYVLAAQAYLSGQPGSAESSRPAGAAPLAAPPAGPAGPRPPRVRAVAPVPVVHRAAPAPAEATSEPPPVPTPPAKPRHAAADENPLEAGPATREDLGPPADPNAPPPLPRRTPRYLPPTNLAEGTPFRLGSPPPVPRQPPPPPAPPADAPPPPPAVEPAVAPSVLVDPDPVPAVARSVPIPARLGARGPAAHSSVPVLPRRPNPLAEDPRAMPAPQDVPAPRAMPAPQAVPAARAMPAPPARSGAAPRGRAPRRRRTGLRVAVVIVAILGVGALAAGSVLAIVAFLAEPPARTASAAGSAGASPSPVASALPPPTGVTYRDNATRISLTWTNPDSNPLALIVVVAAQGASEHPYPALPPGTTTFTAEVNPAVDYCFSVIAVYGGDRLARSRPVCTHGRASPSPSN